MNKIVVVLCVLLFFAWISMAVSRPAQGQTGIILDGADGSRDLTFSLDSGLSFQLDGVINRIVVEYVNAKRDENLAPAPLAMQSTLNRVLDRILLQYVNSKRGMSMAGPPVEMNAGLQNLIPRFVIQYANARRDIVMGYPRDLIGDTTAPQITNITTLIDGSGVRVRWTTNEFTRGTVAYGSQAGAYTANASETYYERQHELLLPPVAPGAQLHFQIVAVDLSGNQAATGDQMVAGQSHVYLPLVRRR